MYHTCQHTFHVTFCLQLVTILWRTYRSIPKFLPLASSGDGENGAANCSAPSTGNGVPHSKLDVDEKPVADNV